VAVRVGGRIEGAGQRYEVDSLAPHIAGENGCFLEISRLEGSCAEVLLVILVAERG
jgi:hypothetical protein